MATLVACIDPFDALIEETAKDTSANSPTCQLIRVRQPSKLILLEVFGSPDARFAVETFLASVCPSIDAEWIPIPVGVELRERLAEVLHHAGVNVTVATNTGPEPVQNAWRELMHSGFVAEWIELRREQGEWKIRSVSPSHAQLVREASSAYAVSPEFDARSDVETACARLGIRGKHPLFLAAVDIAARIAPHPVPVLLRGETGTGKGLLATLIHQLSGRAQAPFVAVNCAALPETLAESILFGHRRGAFTGAISDQPGKFALANGGTLFLDEVGELPLALQAKLLRVVEDGYVEPIGASKAIRVDVRILAATHRDLRQQVASKTFREDLYYRLAFAQIELPPLRERRSDIKPLALYHLNQINRFLPVPRRIDASAIERLEEHSWPGNVRELANVIGRSALLSDRPVLQREDIRIDPLPANQAPHDAPFALPEPHQGFSLEKYLDEIRERLISRALELASGNQAQAARLLGMSPQALHKRLRKHSGSTEVD